MGKSLKGKELGVGITQRKDGKYSAKFKSKSGKRIEKYFDKLSEARKWLEETKYEDSHGNIACSSNMTVDAWFEYWITEIKEKTVKWNTSELYKHMYKKHIKSTIGNMIITDVLPMHCQNILNVMSEKQYMYNTITRARITMNAMFVDALENSLIAVNPITKSVKVPKNKGYKKEERRILTLDEQEIFLRAAKKNVYYLHYLFVLQTGVRCGELLGLRWEDVDLKNRIIHIRQNVVYNSSTNEFMIGELKTNAGYRDIPMTQIAYDSLIEIKKQRDDKKICPIRFANHIFLNSKGNLSPDSNYNMALKRICKRLGIANISMHTFRHTFATRCIESGMKPKTLQKILGHSTLSMTMDLYVHVTEDEKYKEMQKFEEMFDTITVS